MKIFAVFLWLPLMLVGIVLFNPKTAEGWSNLINTDTTTDTTNTTYRPDTNNETSATDKNQIYDSAKSDTIYTAPISFTNSVVYNTTYGGGILYYQATKSILRDFYVAGLDSPAVSVGYNGKVYNNQTKALITTGSVIPIGTVLRFEPSLGDITFNATGGTWGTPYGVWYDQAGFPDGPTFSYVGQGGFTYRGAKCSDIYKVGSITGGIYNNYNLYVPFSVDPTTPSVAVSGDAKLTPISSNVYRVDTAGAIKAVMTFPATYGKFYYEYTRPSDGCHVSWDVIPMANSSKSPVSITIPAQTLTYNLTVTGSNASPAAPTITSSTVVTDGAGNHSASLGSLQTFNFQATDPDGDTLHYAIDWFNDGTVTGFSPSSGYVASGAVSSSNYSLPVSGTTYTFKARTEDSKGGVSGWTPYTITLIAAPIAPVVNLKINGFDGPLSLTKGAAKNITWTTMNCPSSTCVCTASSSDGWSGNKTPVSSGLSAEFANVTSNHTLSCTVPSVGTGIDSVQVNVTCAVSTGIYGACNCSTEKKSRSNTNAACLPWTETVDCDSSEKNSCRDFNWKEVAP